MFLSSPIGRGTEKGKKDGNNTFSEVYDSLARDVTARDGGGCTSCGQLTRSL
jgi:hypothetical protein